MNIGDRIKGLRNNLDMSQVEFADKIGVSKQTLYKYENGVVTNIPSDKIEAIARLGQVTPAYLMGWENDEKETSSHKYVRIPVLGRVAAGLPSFAEENIIDWEDIPAEMARTGDYFGLEIHGDSMAPRMLSGDVIIVRKQENADNGDVVVVLVNGDEGTCKRLIKGSDGITLMPFNPAYQPFVYTKQQIEELPVRICGKVVELRGKF